MSRQTKDEIAEVLNWIHEQTGKAIPAFKIRRLMKEKFSFPNDVVSNMYKKYITSIKKEAETFDAEEAMLKLKHMAETAMENCSRGRRFESQLNWQKYYQENFINDTTVVDLPNQIVFQVMSEDKIRIEKAKKTVKQKKEDKANNDVQDAEDDV